MTILKIIHLSDLHFSCLPDEIRRLKQLESDIQEQCLASNVVICFTGDLTKSGKREQFEALYDVFFSKVADKALIYTCAGNHDVDQDLTNFAIASNADKAREGYAFSDTATPFGKNCPLEQYSNTQEAISNYKTVGFFTSIGREPDFDIVSINTAWMSVKRDKPYSDKGLLKVDQKSLDRYLEHADDGKFRILLMHHPISWLDHPSQIYLNTVIERDFDLVLYGHEHEPTAKAISTQQGNALLLQATASQANWSNGLNGYSIVNVATETKAVQINYRSYSTFRNVYINSNDIVDGAVFYPRDADRNYWTKELSTNPDHLLQRSVEALSRQSSAEMFERIYSAKNKLESTPIDTKFTRLKYVNGERRPTNKINVSACLETDGKYKFFLGPRDSGLTLSSYLAFKDECENIGRNKSIPVYINVEETLINKEYFLKKIQTNSPTFYTRPEVEILAETGSVTFIIDSICIQQQSKLTKLRNILETHFQNCKAYIFCSLNKRNSDITEEGKVSLDPDRDTIFQISQMSSEDIRAMINSKATYQDEKAKENLLNNAVISFKAMDEPIYPSTVSLLIDTLLQLPDFRPVNRVRLLDRYVECLLGRFSIDDVTTGQFNSSDKSNLLSYIAGKMVENKETTLANTEIERMIAAYAQEKMIEIPKNTLSEFLEKGILMQDNSGVTFRGNSMFSYFVAKEMTRNHEVFRKITDTDSFCSYEKELVYYGELEGVDNSTLLQKCREYTEALELRVVESYQREGKSLEASWNKLLSQHHDAEEDIQRISADAVEKEATPEDKTRSRDLDLHSQPRRRGVGSRAVIDEYEAKWLITIQIYLQLMKYSSNIGGKEKVGHLNAVLSSLERFAQTLAVNCDEIASSPFYAKGGILYINPLAAIDPERSKRDFKFAAPLSVSDIVCELMGTSQLSIPIRAVHREASDFKRFIARNLLMDVPSTENQKLVCDSFIDEENVTLQTASLRALKSKYLDYKNTKSEREYHAKIVAELNGRRDLKERLNKKTLDKQRLINKISQTKIEDA